MPTVSPGDFPVNMFAHWHLLGTLLVSRRFFPGAAVVLGPVCCFPPVGSFGGLNHEGEQHDVGSHRSAGHVGLGWGARGG